MQAVGDVLAELGLAGVELADIARRAGVGQDHRLPAVGQRRGAGRRPAGRHGRTVDAPLAHRVACTGTCEANARLVQQTLDDRRQGRVFAALIAAATGDPPTAQALERFYDVRIAEWAPCVDEAVDAGRTAGGHR